MSYKIEIQNNFFVVTDTATGIEEIREVRDQVKWRVSGSVYSFFYNIANLVDQNSPNIIRLGENAKEFDFSEIVDSTETPFASRAIFNDLLNVNLGFMIRETSSVWGLITGDINDQTDLQTILNGKFDVPTGDTTQYIAGDGTLITFPVAGQAGTLVREVRNKTGATLTKGTIVYINGANGNKPTVDKALATSDATSAQTFGFLQNDIANNANGYAVVMGDFIGLDTSAITEGTQLYLSSTVAGEYTSTKQVAPAHLVYVGIVTRSHATLGQIEVKIQNGYELDELHDVLISGETDGQVLQFEGASGLWKNKTLATGLTVGTTSISSGTDGRVLFQNGGVLQQSANLTFGTGLKVLSNGVNDSFVINNSADSSTLFRVTKEGYFHSNYYWQFNRLNGTTLELYSLTTGFSFREGGAPFALLGLNESKFGNTNTNDSVLAIRTSTAYGGEYPLGSILQGQGTNGSVVLSASNGPANKVMLGYYNGTIWASALEYNNTASGGAVIKLIQNGSGAVSIGQSTNGARLDVRAQGALSTDLAFRVRNSANTADLLNTNGLGQVTIFNNANSSSLLSMDSTNTFASVTLENFSLYNTTFKKVLGVQSYNGTGLRYLSMSDLDDLHWNHRFTLVGLLKTQGGIQSVNTSNDFNGSTITQLFSLNMKSNASLVMRPDLNLGLTENNLGLFIAPNSTQQPTKKLIKVMDSTLTTTYFTVNGSGQTAIGTDTPSARLHILAQGALSTDIAFKVRNSANTADLFNVIGNGYTNVIALEASGFINIKQPAGQYYPNINLIANGSQNCGTFEGYNGGLYLKNATYFNIQPANVYIGAYNTGVASAVLTVNSTTKGFLPPRMTNAERIAIASPAVGLMVYCTDATEGLYVYKSTGWTFVI